MAPRGGGREGEAFLVRILFAACACALGVWLLVVGAGRSADGVERERAPGGVDHAAEPFDGAPPEARARAFEPPRRAVAEDAGPALRAEVAGEVLVGEPEDCVSLRGGGTLVLGTGGGDAELRVPLEDGAFSHLLPPGAAQATALSVRAEDGTELHLGAGRELTAGAENELYVLWPARRVRLHVCDAKSGAELDGLAVWSIAGATRSSFDAFDEQPPGPVRGPTAADRRLVQGAESPFDLTLPAASPGGLWVVREGYLPLRWRFPSGNPPTAISLRLEPACALEVRIDGAPRGAGERVRIYDAGGAPWGLPLRELEPAPLSHVEDLMPGKYEITLEEVRGHGEDEPDRSPVLADRGAELSPGERTSVVLTPADPTALQRAAHITLRFPADLDAGATAELHPCSRDAARLTPRDTMQERPVEAGETLGPLSVAPGTYLLELDPARLEISFDLAPGEERTIEIPPCALQLFTPTFVDARTGAPLRPYLVQWVAPMDANGSFLPPVRFGRPLDVSVSPLTFSAPRARLALIVAALPDFTQHHVQVDLRDGRDPTIPIETSFRIDVGLHGLDEGVPFCWAYGIELVRPSGEALRPSGVAIAQIEDPEATLCFPMLPADEEVTLRFPPLPSYGAVPDRTLQLEPGETPAVRIGPEDFGPR